MCRKRSVNVKNEQAGRARSSPPGTYEDRDDSLADDFSGENR